MKLSGPKLLTDHKDIIEWLEQFVIDQKHITVNDNGSVSVNSGVHLQTKQHIGPFIEGRLPINFDSVHGSLHLTNQKLLTSLEGFPRIVKNLDIRGTAITSLVGISDVIKQVEIILLPFCIKEGGLGLLLIEGLKVINVDKMCKAFEIIQKYLGKGEDGLIECQSELIEAGYEEYAIL